MSMNIEVNKQMSLSARHNALGEKIMSICSHLVLQLTWCKKSKEHVDNQQWAGQCQNVGNFLIRPCGETDCTVFGITYA